MNKLFNNIYRGKRVLVTGHTGFKGSWLSLWLKQLGAYVVGYSIDIPTQPSHFELLQLDLPSVMDDVLNKEKLFETIKQHQPDIVFHLAAQPIVRKSYVDPVGTFETNIMGTVNLFESCRQVKNVKAIVNITSDKCYQNNEVLTGYLEKDPMGGDDPYSASKGCAELISHAYRHSFFNSATFGQTHSTLLASVRAGNVIGGGDWAENRLIPDIMKATSKNETVIIRSPQAVRPWQHVLEPLSGYLQLGWKLLEGRKEYADSWNFGPAADSSLTVQQVVEQVKKYWDSINYEIIENPEAPHEAKLLNLDSTKARQQLKWKSIWDAEKTFEKTISWYKQYYQTKKISSVDDLAQYEYDAKQAGVEWTLV